MFNFYIADDVCAQLIIIKLQHILIFLWFISCPLLFIWYSVYDLFRFVCECENHASGDLFGIWALKHRQSKRYNCYNIHLELQWYSKYLPKDNYTQAYSITLKVGETKEQEAHGPHRSPEYPVLNDTQPWAEL